MLVIELARAGPGFLLSVFKKFESSKLMFSSNVAAVKYITLEFFFWEKLLINIY